MDDATAEPLPRNAHRTESPLLTDLYQLSMLEAYLAEGMDGTAVFELFVRRLPPGRGFLLAAGLEQALAFLESAAVSQEERDWLESTGRFSDRALDWLAGFRFSGSVEAMPEGTVFFPDEPILRVTAPLPEAQFVETRLINLLHFETMVASKAARMVLAAPGRALTDFGLRRAHGAEAGILAARAAWIAGFAGTATVTAGHRFGIPLQGTMAHSFVQAHDDEAAAFEAFARARPKSVVLLIDTYDTEAAARKVVALAPRLAADDITIRAVRIDSGDLDALSRKVRAILDAGSLPGVEIIASGGLDEDDLAAFVAAGAPIDAYGIGTSLTTSADAPSLDCAYKLEEYDGIARRKRSPGKETWPGRKQVFRRFDGEGRMAGDLLTLEGAAGEGEALLVPVMRGGRRLDPPEPLADIRARAARSLASLPEPLARLAPGATYAVEVAEPLRRLAAEVDHRLAEREGTHR